MVESNTSSWSPGPNSDVLTRAAMVLSPSSYPDNHTWNSNETTHPNTPEKVYGQFERMFDQVPLFGYPGPMFTALHVTAITSLSTSAVVSLVLIIYLCCFQHRSPGKSKKSKSDNSTSDDLKKSMKHHGSRKTISDSFWKWNVGERLVMYLGVADFTMAVSCTIDHAYMFYTVQNPPDYICATFAFFTHNFIMAQWFIIVYTAVGSCSLVVFGKKLNLGRYDWRLLLFSYGIPTIIGSVASGLGLLGQSGVWCLIDLRTVAGQRYGEFYSVVQIVSAGIMPIAYGTIWYKIKQTANLLDADMERYRNSAKQMMIFVAIFVLQWWSLTMVDIWFLFGVPPAFVVLFPLSLANLGGVYNSVAYTIIRRRFQAQTRSGTKSVGAVTTTPTSSGTTSTSTDLGDKNCYI